jgi:hypothetical protein
MINLSHVVVVFLVVNSTIIADDSDKDEVDC